MEIVTTKKEEGRQTLLIAQVNVQNIREMDTKRVNSQKVSVPAPQSSKTVFLSMLFYPAFLCFEYKLRCLTRV